MDPRSKRPRQLRRELGNVAAGITVGAMLVPQAMAYAVLAGLPPEVGLYASITPLLAYAAIGTSRQLAVGPVAIVSLLSAAALGSVGGDITATLAAAATLAVLVGLIHLVVGAFRLGSMVTLVSHSALVGFTAAAGMIIGLSQAKHLFGVESASSKRLHQSVAGLVRAFDDAHLLTVGLAAVAITALFLLRHLAPKAPAAFVVVAVSIAVSSAFDLDGRGVAVVGAVPGDLPGLALPPTSLATIGQLLPSAVLITLVGFMESFAVARTCERKHTSELDPNRELLGLGMANVAAGVFGGYPVTGGFSRTAVNDAAGATSRIAGAITATVVALTVVALAPLLAALPMATLGAVIIAAVVSLIDVAEIRTIASSDRREFGALVAVFLTTLFVGVEVGIAVAVATSVAVRSISRPSAADSTALHATNR